MEAIFCEQCLQNIKEFMTKKKKKTLMETKAITE